MADRDAWNELRVDLYRRLLPRIRREDQSSGAQGFDIHWDDPNAEWDSAGDPTKAVQMSWDHIGLAPFIQELFYVLETMEGEELEVLESLDALFDPLRCPESVLTDIAASFGYALEDSLDEPTKRTVVLGLQHALKTVGQTIGFHVFYRMAGFRLLNVIPLFKKDVFEENDDYSQERYSVTPITGKPVGPITVTSFAGQFGDAPLKPGTVRFTDGAVVVRSREDGTLIGPTMESGTINHKTGAYTLNLAAPAVGAVTASYDRIDEEWPYIAARIDVELVMNPGGGIIPVVDPELVGDILKRLDEVRPIHVLLRALALVFELDDDFSPGATDLENCVTFTRYGSDAVPSIPGSFGQENVIILAEGLRPEDEFTVEQLDPGGARTDIQQCFDEIAKVICPLDLLEIDTGGAVPSADTLW